MANGETPIGNNYTENLLESKEFHIIQDNQAFLILIGKTMNLVTVKCSSYSTNLNYSEISLIAQNQLNSINELYNFIVFIFTNRGVKVEMKNNEINLYLSFFNNNMKQNKIFMITLTYSANNTDYFINHLWNKITRLESENNQMQMNYQNLLQNFQYLKNEIDSLKNNFAPNNNFINNNMNNMNNNNNMMNGYMNNNFNNGNININNSFNQQMNNGNNSISILFKEQGGGNQVKTLYNCNINDTIAQLMDKYRQKIDNKNLKFYLTFNAKVLNPAKTLKQLGLTNLTTLCVMKGDPPIY